MPYIKLISIFCFLSLFTISCDEDSSTGGNGNKDTFDRQAMLTHWAYNIIIPSYENYNTQIDLLHSDITDLIESPSQELLIQAQESWLTASNAWQMVSLFEVGPAESINQRIFTNTYPTDIELIESNISVGNINLALPSNIVAQGFPAIEYMLFGKETIIEELSNTNTAAYLSQLIEKLSSMSTDVLQAWQGAYKESFISNDGSSATASVNKITNDYIYYFERFVRSGKVSIPAGIFSTTVLPSKVEGRFANGTSKQLFLTALNTVQNFFNGQYNTDSTFGDGFATYLNYLDNTPGLVTDINTHFDNAKSLAEALDDDYAEQIALDNTKLLALHDELQKVTILLKVDMMQALNIKVDYVDADGD